MGADEFPDYQTPWIQTVSVLRAYFHSSLFFHARHCAANLFAGFVFSQPQSKLSTESSQQFS